MTRATSHTPLQAADILAFEGNKRMRDPKKPERRSWTALNSNGRVTAMHFGRENMEVLIHTLEAIRDNPPTGDYLAWKRSFGRGGVGL